MANITGDYDVAMELGLGLVNSVVAALHENDDDDNYPRLPHSLSLVVDDTYDSGWTLTVVAHRLREAGADAVLPFVLARR